MRPRQHLQFCTEAVRLAVSQTGRAEYFLVARRAGRFPERLYHGRRTHLFLQTLSAAAYYATPMLQGGSFPVCVQDAEVLDGLQSMYQSQHSSCTSAFIGTRNAW